MKKHLMIIWHVLLIILIQGFSFALGQYKDSIESVTPVAPWFVEKFNISAGFFYPVNNTNIQVGINGNSGTDIDFEKDLGFNQDVGTFLAAFQWRISRRSRINLCYYNLHRTTTHTLEKDIIFEDNTYHISSIVNAFFNTGIYQISYGYAIIAKPTLELGLLVGTHTVAAKAGISLNGSSVGISQTNDFGFTAPLPDLGIWGGYSFSRRLAVNLDADYLAMTINKISGRLLAYNLVFIYRLIDHLNISAGYTGLNFNISTTKKNVTGQFKWGYNGPAVAACFYFGNGSWRH